MEEIKHPGNNPTAVAKSMAIGVFIAIAVPMGVQFIAFAILLMVYKYNFVIANGISLISNPFSVLPIYYLGINVGETILGMKFPWIYFDRLVENPKWDYLIEFGADSIIILLSGLFTMAIFASLITYFLFLKVTFLIKGKNAVL